MFADPQSITVGANTYSLARTGSGINTGQFDDATHVVEETISHTYGKRTRRLLRFDFDKIAADTFNPTLNTQSSMGCYIVLDIPTTGFSTTEQSDFVKGLLAYMTASSYAAVAKFIGGEA